MYIIILTFLLLVGCTTSALLNNPTVTATQQLIVSSAEQKAVNNLPISLLPHKLTYVDSSNFTGSKYELELFRSQLIKLGVPVTDTQSKSAVTIELFSSVDSYNVKSEFVGVPPLPAGLFADTPKITLYGKNTDIAISQVNFVAFNTNTGNFVAVAFSKYGVQYYSNTEYAFFGSHEYPKLKDLVK